MARTGRKLANAALGDDMATKLADFMAKYSLTHSQAVRQLLAVGLRDVSESTEAVYLAQAREEAYLTALRAYHEALKTAAQGVREHFKNVR